MRAQISAEFLVVVSALMSIFLFVYVVFLSQNINLFQARESITSMKNAYALSAALNYVHLAGDGAQLNFTLSGKENDENITISDVSVESRKTYTAIQAPLLNPNTNTSSVEGGRMIIKNNGGVIEIEQ
jgi:hypothetical protein